MLICLQFKQQFDLKISTKIVKIFRGNSSNHNDSMTMTKVYEKKTQTDPIKYTHFIIGRLNF